MQIVNIDILNSHIIELDERLEGFALATATSFQNMQEQMDQRFEQADKRFDELKEMAYSNGDAIARMMKKMDEEFSAATAQRQRLGERIERLEQTYGFA
ncbi:hypothetical protein HYV69_03935 [Candidatus Uhrbacteria bacterium]|nr:hypothetical protein [Candidatus Uhrbacteria bacterium]